MEEKQARNPTDGIYHHLGVELSCQSSQLEMDESKPVEAIVTKMDNIINMINQNMMVGEHYTDIARLKSDNSFILISNHIHPSIRSGFVTRFNQYEDIPNCVANYLNPGHGLANSVAIRDTNEKDHDDSLTRIFVGFDSGHIIMLDTKLSILSTKQFCHNIITKIVLSPNQQDRLVCGDFDGRLVLIDANRDMESLTYYDNAHSDPINDLVFRMDDVSDNTIITAGADHSILLWDFRISRTDRPASTIAQVTSQPTALDCVAEHELIFGTETGNLVRLDLRNSSKILQKHSLFSNQYEYDDDMSVIKIHPLKQHLSCVLTAHQYWLIERQNLDTIIDNHHSTYFKRVHLKNCLAINDDNDLLIIGNNFNHFLFPNILM